MRPTKWTAEAMKAAVAEFYNTNKRYPKTCELDGLEMLPCHSLFKRTLGMTYNEWLKREFNTVGVMGSFGYANKMEKYGGSKEIISTFVSEYNRIMPISSAEFDSKRATGTLGWRSVAKISNVKTWKQLLGHLGLKEYEQDPQTFIIKMNVDPNKTYYFPFFKLYQ